MNILYIGSLKLGQTSNDRAQALIRLGHKLYLLDPYQDLNYIFFKRFISWVHLKTGYRFLQPRIIWNLKHKLNKKLKYDLIWIDSGELFGPNAINFLKKITKKIVIYNHDDPTGSRDGRRFSSLIRAIPFYDLCVAVREETYQEYLKLGAMKALKVWRSYDEVVHLPSSGILNNKYITDVVFIGTYIKGEDRDKFLLKLIEAGIKVKIWGDRWEKSPFSGSLQNYLAGGNLSGGEYVAAITQAKICIGLLSKGNRDLHTTRSMEIPYAGGLLCAERTSEHQFLYKEGVEAVFWSTPEECIMVCKKLLRDEALRESIRIAGMKRVRKNMVGHEDQCKIILKTINNA